MIGQPPRDTPATGASALPEEIVENELPSQEVGVADVPEALVYVAPQWKLVWWRFRKHRLATISAAILLVIYGVAAFAEFVAPTTGDANNPAYTYAPPQRVHVWDSGHLGLYVYGYKMTRDPVTLEQSFKVDRTQKIPLTLFGRGPSYRMWGLFDTSRHLLAPTPRDAPVYLLGANALGQDMLSRVIYGARISMSIGLVGVALSLVLGMLLGGISGLLRRRRRHADPAADRVPDLDPDDPALDGPCRCGPADLAAAQVVLRDHGDPVADRLDAARPRRARAVPLDAGGGLRHRGRARRCELDRAIIVAAHAAARSPATSSPR